MKTNDKIFVAGHKGLVGSALVKRLKILGYHNLILRSHAELDLTDQYEVRKFFETEKPDYVFLAAGKVGGIYANNKYPAEFIYINNQIICNVIHYSWVNKVKKLLFLGSSCIYPKLSKQPIKEEYLLSGYLEPTNAPYAIAKIAGIVMCQSYNRQYGTTFISAMPTNLYGPNDNYHPENSHVLPALIRKFHEAKVAGAKSVSIWGSGKPKREFLYSEDCADACIFLMNNYDENNIVNVGSGKEVSIKELADIIKEVVGFRGDIEFNTEMPDGTLRKLLDCSKLNSLGWKSTISMFDGIGKTYIDYLNKMKITRRVL